MAEGIHKIGSEAIAALKALNQAKAAKKAKAAKATELIEERNEIVRPLLKQVHEHIAGGGAVNGHTTWAGWAKYAGWSKRALNYILNGRKPQSGNSSSRSSFLKRIADAKKKLTDIQSQIDAPFKDGETRNMNALYAQINPAINGVFQKFLALISPDGYEVRHASNGWMVHEKDEQPAPAVTHIKVSARKTLCQTRFVNRKIKGMVFAKDGETVTCPDCVKVRGGQLGGGTLQKVRDEKNKKEEVPAPIKIKLTKAQAREVRIAGNLSLGSDWEKHSRTLEFHPNLYELQAKQLVEALEQRIDDLTAESKALRKTMSDWNDKSPENAAKFKEHAGIDGAMKACDAAIRSIVFGDVESDDPTRNIREWHEQRVDERLGISEPPNEPERECPICNRTVVPNRHSIAECKRLKTEVDTAAQELEKTMGASVDGLEGAELTWGQKVCIPGSPENLQHLADLKHRREFPYIDPKEADDESEDCEEDCPTDEDSEEEVL